MRTTTLNNTLIKAKDYKSVFIPDGGEMNSDNLMKAAYYFLLEKDLYDNTRLLFMPEAGIKIREDGSDKLIAKGYDLSDFTNNVEQTTAFYQPFLSEYVGTTHAANASFGAYFDHPTININGDNTLIKATFNLGELGVNVEVDTISTGTLDKVEWNGDLFYYRINEGLMTQSEIDYETEWLESWINPYDNMNYQGLEWVQKSATGYTRLGTISDIPVSQSAGDANLPIQSEMKRCLLLDNGTVNYFIDADDPIQQDGDATYTATGTATSIATDELIDSNADFVTDNVEAGMAVRNTTTGKIAIIYDVV